jgi:hypothetical protein
MRKWKAPDPYLWLMDPDSNPGGPKRCGSGSPTLAVRLPGTFLSSVNSTKGKATNPFAFGRQQGLGPLRKSLWKSLLIKLNLNCVIAFVSCRYKIRKGFWVKNRITKPYWFKEACTIKELLQGHYFAWSSLNPEANMYPEYMFDPG